MRLKNEQIHIYMLKQVQLCFIWLAHYDEFCSTCIFICSHNWVSKIYTIFLNIILNYYVQIFNAKFFILWIFFSSFLRFFLLLLVVYLKSLLRHRYWKKSVHSFGNVFMKVRFCLRLQLIYEIIKDFDSVLNSWFTKYRWVAPCSMAHVSRKQITCGVLVKWHLINGSNCVCEIKSKQNKTKQNRNQ